MGGYFLTKKGESLVYDAEGGNYHNKDGQICTMDKGLLDEFFEFYGQFKGEMEWFSWFLWFLVLCEKKKVYNRNNLTLSKWYECFKLLLKETS